MKLLPKTETGLMIGQIPYSINAEISPYVRLQKKKILLAHIAVLCIVVACNLVDGHRRFEECLHD
jgi:hypothetical protein